MNSAPSLLGLKPSFGFGDRLGLAGRGHVRRRAERSVCARVRAAVRAARLPVRAVRLKRRSPPRGKLSKKSGGASHGARTPTI